MAYRRRDSGKAGYSSADAYRIQAVSPTSSSSHAPPSSSSEEEAHLAVPRQESPESSSADQHAPDDDAPLSPPRPFFLAGSRKSSNASEDRGSWSSINDSVEAASDSDHTDREAASTAAGAAQPGARRVRANTAGAASQVPRPRNHHRRRSSQGSPPMPTDSAGHLPSTSRAPPSAFPFLSHAGNPDPGTPIPGTVYRRPSRESFRRTSGSGLPGSPPPTTAGVAYPTSPGNVDGYSALRAERTSMDVADGYAYAPVNGHEDDLGRPHPPFAGDADRGSWIGGGGGSVYRNSAAAAMTGSNGTLPRSSSQVTIPMRAPFLSPASRPTSSLWSPPSYPSLPQHLTSQYPPSLSYMPNSPYASGMSPYKPKMGKAPLPSSRLTSKLTPEDKPWLKQKEPRERWAYWLTIAMFIVGMGCSAIVIYFGWTGVRQLKDDQLCMVLNEDFSSLDLDNTWNATVALGGFGNGEFQATTKDAKNLYTKNGQLYIMPTFTSDDVGKDAVLKGGKLQLDGCTAGSDSNCTATSNGAGQALPPVKSARISTQGHYSIQFGKVEVRAKLPRGDWLWPAIWMLPEDTPYGGWPMSGEIDIMEARGNAPTYPAQGNNFVRSTLNYGIFETLQTHIMGWWQEKRFTYSDDFHTFALEWSPDFIRTYVDSKLQATLTLAITGKGGHSFFDRGHYPPTARNDSAVEAVVTNIWEAKGGSPAAPFDKPFYLILDLAVGGTSGWFPDGVGNKPWFDTSGDQQALWDFANKQDTWAATWPSSDNDRAFRIDSVKMWKLKQGGKC